MATTFNMRDEVYTGGGKYVIDTCKIAENLHYETAYWFTNKDGVEGDIVFITCCFSPESAVKNHHNAVMSIREYIEESAQLNYEQERESEAYILGLL